MSNAYPKLSLNECKTMLKNAWRKRDVKLKPLFLSGVRGIGKSQLVAQAAKELSEETGFNVECRVVTLSVMESPDLQGIPYISEGNTVYGRPYFLPQTGHGLLFLDESNRGNKDLQNALLTLIENREINGFKLGEGWTLILAGNPHTQGSSGPKYDVKGFDDALADRLSFYTINPAVKEVTDYLKSKYGASNKVVSWLLVEPGMVCLDGMKPTSPRSLEYLIKALKVHTDTSPFTVAAGVIGQDAAYAFNNFLNNPHTLTTAQLFNITPEIADIIVDTQKSGEQMATLNYWAENFVAELVRLSGPDKDKAAEKKAKKKDKAQAGGAVATVNPPKAEPEEAPEVVVDFLKSPELAKKTSEFMSLLKTADFLDSFLNRLGEHMEQDEDVLKKQFESIWALNPKVFADNLKESIENS